MLTIGDRRFDFQNAIYHIMGWFGDHVPFSKVIVQAQEHIFIQSTFFVDLFSHCIYSDLKHVTL